MCRTDVIPMVVTRCYARSAPMNVYVQHAMIERVPNVLER